VIYDPVVYVEEPPITILLSERITTETPVSCGRSSAGGVLKVVVKNPLGVLNVVVSKSVIYNINIYIIYYLTEDFT
jgi:hypothetical protein